jgi:tRNA dimethylallyltransferase
VPGPRPHVLVVVGPTGSGKSELGLRLAEEFSGEIVGCDSVQIYRRFNIGTAKLAESERRGIPHHLIDICDPETLFTAGEYAKRGREALREIAGRGHLPIVVGGTGFYLRALLDGLFPGPQRDEALRERLSERERLRPGSLHRLLRRLDPASAMRIHANDVNKTMRALEVTLLRKEPMSEQFQKGRAALEGFRIYQVGLNPPVAELYARLEQRVRQMFDGGLEQEVRNILSKGDVSTNVKAFASLGYRQALALVEGEMLREEAISSTQMETRRYAKRQMTWFRGDPEIKWFTGFGNDPEIQKDVVDYVRVQVSQ